MPAQHLMATREFGSEASQPRAHGFRDARAFLAAVLLAPHVHRLAVHALLLDAAEVPAESARHGASHTWPILLPTDFDPNANAV